MSFLIVISALGVAAFALYTVYQNNQDSGGGSGNQGAGATPSPNAGVSQASAPLPSVSGGSGNYYSSDGSITGSQITNDPGTWPASTITGDKVWMICAAVASAEGYNKGPGNAPYNLNNPGDVSPGDEAGEKTCGAAEQHGGSAIVHFCTAEGGWRALYHKFSRIVAGQSTVYPIYFSWNDIAKIYAGNSAAWVANVTSFLGVDPDTTPAGYVTAP